MSKYSKWSIQVGRIAAFSAMAEALSAPSPGLVNRFNNGSHADMNIFTFAASSALLTDYFMEAAEQGLARSNDKKGNSLEYMYSEFYRILNRLGRDAEDEMWDMIGVNTHKGLIYLLILLCGAAGLCFEEKQPVEVEDICTVAGAIARPQIELELENARYMRREELSTGLRSFLDYGLQGIRGEVRSDFYLCRKVGVTALNHSLESGSTINDALAHCLFLLMMQNKDTTLLNRTYQSENISLVCKWAKRIVELGSVFTEEGRKCINEFQRIIVQKRISPGGSSDLVAVSFFLWLINYIQKEECRLQRLLARDNTRAFI